MGNWLSPPLVLKWVMQMIGNGWERSSADEVKGQRLIQRLACRAGYAITRELALRRR